MGPETPMKCSFMGVFVIRVLREIRGSFLSEDFKPRVLRITRIEGIDSPHNLYIALSHCDCASKNISLSATQFRWSAADATRLSKSLSSESLASLFVFFVKFVVKNSLNHEIHPIRAVPGSEDS